MDTLVHSGNLSSPQLDLEALSSRVTGRFLAICFAAIGAISALDTWFAVANTNIMIDEQNPICLTLMRLEPNGMMCFIFSKLLGTVMVLVSLLMLHRFSFKHTRLVVLGVTLFQVGLLTHLTLSDPLFYGLPNFSLLFQETPNSIWRLN